MPLRATTDKYGQSFLVRLVAISMAMTLPACGARRDDRARELPPVHGKPVPEAQVVESLVDEELMAQAAEEQFLDREPDVEQAIANARRRILVLAFAERNLYPKQAIAPAEAREFYEAHPFLFESRKRFQVKTYNLDAASSLLSRPFDGALENIHTDVDLRKLLDLYGFKYMVQEDDLAADQLPLDKLKDFEHALPGDIMVARPADGKLILMLVTGVRSEEPLSFDRAKPYIETYLVNSRNREAVEAYLSRVRADGRTENEAGGRHTRRAIEKRDRAFSAVATATGGLP